jgi:hypothetical protein
MFIIPPLSQVFEQSSRTISDLFLDDQVATLKGPVLTNRKMPSIDNIIVTLRGTKEEKRRREFHGAIVDSHKD